MEREPKRVVRKALNRGSLPERRRKRPGQAKKPEAELKAASYIREALLVDDRVVEVKDMQVKGQNNHLSVSFSVVTKEGVLEQEWEVSEVGIKVL